MPDIMHLLKIHAPAARIYQALTTSEDIRNWWTRDADLENVWGGIGDSGSTIPAKQSYAACAIRSRVLDGLRLVPARMGGDFNHL